MIFSFFKQCWLNRATRVSLSLAIIASIGLPFTGCIIAKQLIFQPIKLSSDFKFTDGSEEVYITTKDNEEINGIFFEGNKNEVVLYFHGNYGNLSNWQSIESDFIDAGYKLFIIDYRGYGKSSGSISEKGFYKDAEAAFSYLTNKKNISPKDIIIYGTSLGTGVAVDLASKHRVKGLILESSYTSIKKLASRKVPFLLPFLWLPYDFNNLDKINTVQSHILFIHGTEDKLIPPKHTKKIYSTFNGGKEILLVPNADHNTIRFSEEYKQALVVIPLKLFH